MNRLEPVAFVTALTFLIPVTAFVLLATLLLLRVRLSESVIARSVAVAMVLSFVAASIGLVAMAVLGRDRVTVHLGEWFAVSGYAFDFVLLVDRLSLPFMLLTTALIGVIGKFSRSYMHRDPGYPRFFLLLLLFSAGMLLIVMAGTIDLLFAGWEIVGVTSALLIGFFHGRREPVTNGLRTYAIYRLCDVGLLVAAVLIHHAAHTAQFEVAFDAGAWPGGLAGLEGTMATAVGLLLVFAAMGKSAQVPFSGWLPRAMEGPTPSSAVFYGALSIHAGAYLVLRTSPIFDASEIASATLVAVGVASAIHGTLVGRVQCNAKNSLAYASMVQVGLILAEIGLGLRLLAVLHIVAHASVRTLQFLRAPSMLHDFHQVEAAAGGELGETGRQYSYILPEWARRWLYRLALERGYHDELLAYAVTPVMRAIAWLDRAERRLIEFIGGSRRPPAASATPEPVRASVPVAEGGQP